MSGGNFLPLLARKYFEINQIYSVSLVYYYKMSTTASLGAKEEKEYP